MAAAAKKDGAMILLPTRVTLAGLTNFIEVPNSPLRIQTSAVQWTVDMGQRFTNTTTDGLFGRQIAPAGDVNGDGFRDVIIGAQGVSDRSGMAFVFHGSRHGLGTSAAWTVSGKENRSVFGNAVGGGDLNGDGYSDAIVGAWQWPGNRSPAGRTVVYYGTPSGLRDEVGWSVSGHQRETMIGASVSATGDLNGDGFADLAIGARRYKHELMREGAVLVFYGSAQRLHESNKWFFPGGQENAQLGASVAIVGDVNGDGVEDLLVGAPISNTDKEAAGRIFLFFGSRAGLNVHSNWSAIGAEGFSNFGASVAAAGDINGDGLADFLVGAPGSKEGIVCVYYGSRLGRWEGPGLILRGEMLLAQFGHSVSGAGDVNADGFDDVLVGAPLQENHHTKEGRAYLYLGSKQGLDQKPSWIVDGGKLNAHLGACVARAGDVNGDAIADFLVGSPNYDCRYRREGRVDLFYGSVTRFSRTNLLTVITNHAMLSATPVAFIPANSWRVRLSLAAAIAIVFVACVFHVLRQRRVLKNERNRIARDLHDDFGSELTQLSLLTTEPSKDSATRETVSRATEQAAKALQTIVWSIDPKHDNLESFVTFLVQHSERFFQQTGIHCRKEMPLKVPEQHISPEVRKNLALAVKEALNNVVKHAGATEVWMRVSFDDSVLLIQVEDNGRGIAQDTMARDADETSSNGLRNMRMRLEKIGGTFDIERRSQGGTLVIFRLKLS